MADIIHIPDGDINNYRKFTGDAGLYHGDCLDFLKLIDSDSTQLVITSPPYNMGKKYEDKKSLNDYLLWQEEVIKECVRILKPDGSICWQVGTYVGEDGIIPLDMFFAPIFWKFGLKMRNRIIWHFGHGLHCKKRFSGRYESIIWFTKSDDYYFNLDAVRVKQKYPNKKYFKGPKKGQLSCNPLGSNPSDLWSFSNVKHNHPEKTAHPCQFPLALVERCILSMTKEGDYVVDPFLGSGTTMVASLVNRRKSLGADKELSYIEIVSNRIKSIDFVK